MAAGDNYRRIDPHTDQLVFDSGGALVGLKSGASSSKEFRGQQPADATTLAAIIAEYEAGTLGGGLPTIGTIYTPLVASVPTAVITANGNLTSATDQPPIGVRMIVNAGTDTIAAEGLRDNTYGSISINPGQTADFVTEVDIDDIHLVAIGSAAEPADYTGGAYIVSMNETSLADVLDQKVKFVTPITGLRRVRVSVSPVFDTYKLNINLGLVSSDGVPPLGVYQNITDRWLWLPLHEGAGVALRDLAGEINGNGNGLPIFSDSTATLTGTPVGTEWTANPGVLTHQGALIYNQDNAALWEMATLSTLTGTIEIAFRIKAPTNPSAVQNILGLQYSNAAYGGWKVVIGTTRRVGLMYRPVDGSDLTIAQTPGSGAGSLADGAEHSLYITITRNGAGGDVTIYTDGVPVATGALTTGTLSGNPTGLSPLGVFCGAAGGAQLGGGAINLALHSLMMRRTTTPLELADANANALEHHSAPMYPPLAWAAS